MCKLQTWASMATLYISIQMVMEKEIICSLNKYTTVIIQSFYIEFSNVFKQYPLSW